MVAIVIVEFKLLGTVIMKSYIRIIFVLTASLLATHALSQELSGWSDKTVCRLVASDGSAAYVEEASSRGLKCNIDQGKVTKETYSVSTPFGELDFSKCDIDKNADSYLPFYCYGDDGKLVTKSEIKTIIKEKKWVTKYESWTIPETRFAGNYERWSLRETANPNDETLKFYIVKQKNNEDSHDRHGAIGSENFYALFAFVNII